MIDYQLAFLIAIFSYTYTNLLTEPNMIFNGLYKNLNKWMPRWLFYPVIHCEKCNSGWVAVIFYCHDYYIGSFEKIGLLFLFVAFTIYTTYTIKQITNKLWDR